MKKSNLIYSFSLLIGIFFTMTSCSSITVNGDEEAVLIMKPVIFGQGGVDRTPVPSGQEWVAYTTDAIKFKIVPITYAEKFHDMMTNDNTPVDFSAYLKLKVIKGQSPVLYEEFGENWYENSIAPTFRAMVRDKASSHKMFELTSNREILAKIENELLEKIISYTNKLKLPVEIEQVTIGAVTPPNEVLEETRRTAAQNQSKLTQDARSNAEVARKQADINKAIADKAYQQEMNMSIEQYLELRHLEIEKEKVELVRDKQNVAIVMGQGLTPVVPIK